MNIKLLHSGLDVNPVLWQIRQNPQLWNVNTGRTASPESPHHGLDDIWLRFVAPELCATGKPEDCVWYTDKLGCANVFCYFLMSMISGDELGGVLITRIPPGGRVKPHTDTKWHARRHQTFGIQIASAPGQVFCFEGESLETKPGDVFWFNNQHTHWVDNPTPHERITLIVSIRKDGYAI